MLSNDFEIAQCLRDMVIPKAVLYFTGEALDYSDVSAVIVVVVGISSSSSSIITRLRSSTRQNFMLFFCIIFSRLYPKDDAAF